jgi:hypothetical protein
MLVRAFDYAERIQSEDLPDITTSVCQLLRGYGLTWGMWQLRDVTFTQTKAIKILISHERVIQKFPSKRDR